MPLYFRVLVNINIRAEEELRFTETVYNFSALMYSSVGSICGKVTVMHESSTPAIDDKNRQCGYSLLSGSMVPFTIDSHGKSPKLANFHKTQNPNLSVSAQKDILSWKLPRQEHNLKV